MKRIIFILIALFGITLFCGLTYAEELVDGVPTTTGDTIEGATIVGGTVTADITVADDIDLIFGTDSDIQMRYDEAGDNRLEWHDGTNLLMSLTDNSNVGDLGITGSYSLLNDKAFKIGTNNDFQFIYDETTNDRFEFGDGTNDFLTVTDDGTTATFDFKESDIDNAKFYQYEFIPIGAMDDYSTNGPGAITTLTNSGGKASIRNFDGATDEIVVYSWAIPPDMDTSVGINFAAFGYISSSSVPSNGNVISYQLAGNAIATSGQLDENPGTAQASSLTCDANYVQYDATDGAWSSAITLTGISASTRRAQLKLNRDADDVDTYAQDHGLEFIIIRYVKKTIAP